MKKKLNEAANAGEEASNSRALVITARAGFCRQRPVARSDRSVAIQLAFGKAGRADQGGAVAPSWR